MDPVEIAGIPMSKARRRLGTIFCVALVLVVTVAGARVRSGPAHEGFSAPEATEPGPFIFGVVDGRLGYAVISSAHMDPRNFGQDRNEPLLTSRVEKMAARYLGLLAFDLQTGSSPDPRSALRGPVVSLEDLDGMTGRLCPDQPGAPHGC